MTWIPYADGTTYGQQGAEGGQIIYDEEFPGAARITLEQDCLRAPYAITLVIYDWTYITRFIADGPTAEHVYYQIKGQLEADIIPLMGDPDDPDRTIPDVDMLADTIAAFVDQHS